MKIRIFSALICLFLAQFTAQATASTGGDPEVRVVVRASRIWILTDETPALNLVIQVRDSREKVVMEKTLTAASTDWSLNTELLPAGRYSVLLGTKKVGKFEK